MEKEHCIFCDIVSGKLSSYTIYEDNYCMAFLTPYPNTVGQTVVITKKHYSSYFASIPKSAISKLLFATQKVAQILDSAYSDVSRTAMVFEGWGVDHIHAKLYPMHGTSNPECRIQNDSNVFFEKYPGYVTTENKHTRMSEEFLIEQQKKILEHTIT